MDTTPQSALMTNRRSFMLTGAALGAGAYGSGRLLADPSSASAHGMRPHGKRLSKGDVAILQFLAAAEILETDLWQQYNELAGIQDSEVPGVDRAWRQLSGRYNTKSGEAALASVYAGQGDFARKSGLAEKDEEEG